MRYEKEQYDYVVRGAKLFLIYGLSGTAMTIILFFLGGPKVLVGMPFLAFFIFIFFHRWYSLRIGVSKDGLYVLYHGTIAWNDIDSFKVIRRARGLLVPGPGLIGLWHSRWLIINLKEGVELASKPGAAILVGPEMALSKRVDDLVRVLRGYYEKYSF